MIKGNEITQESAFLRGQGKFDEAIEIIEKNISSIDSTIQTVAWLSAFYAARDKGDKDLANKYAKLVAKDDSSIPSIQEYLN